MSHIRDLKLGQLEQLRHKITTLEAQAAGAILIISMKTYSKNDLAGLEVELISQAAKDLKDNSIQDPNTLKEIASSLKTLADVQGTDLSANSDVEDLYQTVVQSQIADLQKTTLTDDQQKTLTQAEDLYGQGKYEQTLELLMTNNN